MINLVSFTGAKAFGKAYQYMLDNDAHAQGSVDREIAASMIRLCHETASYLYDGYTDLSIGYVAGSRPELENLLAGAKTSIADPVQQIAAIAEPTLGLAEKRPCGELSMMRLGGDLYDYVVAGLNDYYRAILSVADRGWPGVFVGSTARIGDRMVVTVRPANEPT